MEAELFINEKHRVAEVFEASDRLLETCHTVVENCVSQVRDINGTWSSHQTSDLIKRYCSLDYLNRTLKGTWAKDEVRIWIILRYEFSLLGTDTPVDARLQEKLQLIDEFTNEYQAFNYFREVQKRLQYLTTEKAKDRLGSIKHSSLSYIESRVLRQALNGKFLTPNN